MIRVDSLETVLGEGFAPSYFLEEALDFGGDDRILDGRGGKGRRRGGGEDKMEKKEETENKRFEAGDQSKESGLERCKLKGDRERREESSSISKSWRLRLR